MPRYPAYKDSGIDWIGEVPAHWSIEKLKQIVRFSGGGTPARDNPDYWNGNVPWVSPKDMKSEAITTSEESITVAGLAAGASSLVPAGTLLMVVRSGILKHTIPVGINRIPVALNQDMKALHPLGVRADFLLRWVQGLNDRLLLVWAKQGATVESIEQDYLANTLVPRPPDDEQSIIVAFLDRETAKIDALIAEQERLLELLAEKRQAFIAQAVTKGLSSDAPMKESGVEWLGEVPAHWRLAPLARITRERCDGPFGSGIKSSHYTDQGALVVRLQNIRAGRFNMGEPVYLDADYFESELQGHAVTGGDVLIAGLGDDNNLLGRACVAPSNLGPALVKADCFRFRLFGDMCPEFIAHQLTAGAAFDAGQLATGTTRSRMPLGTMAGRIVAFPPREEQEAIVARINELLRTLDDLGREAETGIALLHERRTALIVAAVTGQVDVLGFA